MKNKGTHMTNNGKLNIKNMGKPWKAYEEQRSTKE